MKSDVADLLTPREREVLALMARGLTNGEIAQELGISFSTAKTHVSDILTRLGVDSRQQAVQAWGSIDQRMRWRWLWLGISFSRAAGITATAAAVVTALVLVSRLQPTDTTASELRVPLAELSVGVPKEFNLPQTGTSPGGVPYPLWLIRHSDGSVSALIGRDPDGACHVPYEAPASDASLRGMLKARCTGWLYDFRGELVFGASPRGLDRFSTRIDDDEVVVGLSEFILGSCHGESLGPCSTSGREVKVPALPSPVWVAGVMESGQP